MNKKQRAEFILTKLIRILNASAGQIHFLSHEYQDIYKARNSESIEEFRNVFNKLSKKHFTEIINTQNKLDESQLAETAIPPEFLEQYNIIIKPVYLNKQDIAQIQVVLPKAEKIEEQDLKIIRLFSFYLAAAICFKK